MAPISSYLTYEGVAEQQLAESRGDQSRRHHHHAARERFLGLHNQQHRHSSPRSAVSLPVPRTSLVGFGSHILRQFSLPDLGRSRTDSGESVRRPAAMSAVAVEFKTQEQLLERKSSKDDINQATSQPYVLPEYRKKIEKKGRRDKKVDDGGLASAKSELTMVEHKIPLSVLYDAFGSKAGEGLNDEQVKTRLEKVIKMMMMIFLFSGWFEFINTS
jgi:hypothetical protein